MGGRGGAGAVGGTAGTAGVGGTIGGTAGVGGISSGGTGAVSAGGTSGSGGTGGAPMATCKGGDVGPCGGFQTRDGRVIPLGPYGSLTDRNVGAGYEAPVSPLDTAATCAVFAASFGEDPTATSELLNIEGLNLAQYTVYRPANAAPGEKFPLLTWGNGTCAQPEGYGALLRFIASHGFIVVAANGRFVANGAMTKALDFMFAANDSASSPYYQRVDTTKVGAMGHSQGGAATAVAAGDRRVNAVILYNGGTSANKPFFSQSGQFDIGNPTAATLRNAMNASAQSKAAFLYINNPAGTGAMRGHLTLMMEPWRVTDASAAWWKLILNNDASARNMFVGASCGLCTQPNVEFGQKGL
jgi:hypothetical protein